MPSAAQGLDSSHAHQVLLPDAHAAIPVIEAGRELLILWTVPLDGRVQQQQGNSAHRQLPDACAGVPVRVVKVMKSGSPFSSVTNSNGGFHSD